jgi:hypothetical protein
MRRRAWGSIGGVLLAAALGACGGGSHRTASAARPADDGVTVIRAWAQALARGDIAAAGAYFATPSRVQIAPGEPLATVRSAAEARSVNLMLPCGAKLLDTHPVGGYIDALFLLTGRPGADCGSGVGGTARVAFVIRAGRIAVWRRIPDEPGDAARAAPGAPPAPPRAVPPAARIV